MENGKKLRKVFLQNSAEYRITQFNMSVAVKCHRGKKDELAVNFLRACLLC